MDGDAVTADPAEGTRRTVSLDLPQGAQQLTVVARDRAGNETVRRLDVLVDTRRRLYGILADGRDGER